MSKVALRRTNLPSTAPDVKTVEPFIKDMPGEVTTWNIDADTGQPGNMDNISFMGAASGAIVSGVSMFFMGPGLEPILAGGIALAISMPALAAFSAYIQYFSIKEFYEEAFGIEPSRKIIRKICKIQNDIKSNGVKAEKRYLLRADLGLGAIKDEKTAVGLVVGYETCSIMWQHQDAIAFWDEAANNVVELYALDTDVDLYALKHGTPGDSHHRKIHTWSSDQLRIALNNFLDHKITADEYIIAVKEINATLADLKM